eukprot:scaffold445818_cov19-Prasinocladus_malaysianus.AAC.2
MQQIQLYFVTYSLPGTRTAAGKLEVQANHISINRYVSIAKHSIWEKLMQHYHEPLLPLSARKFGAYYQ